MNRTIKIALISFVALLLLAVIILGILIGSILYPSALVSGTGNTRIVCVGDSITYGQGVIGSRDEASYTAYLSEMIEDSTVVNYGLCNRTLLSSGNMPYTEDEHYELSRAEDADIVIIMLGSNDSKPDYWDKETFAAEYRSFIEGYINMASVPEVYVMIPPRVYSELQSRGGCDDAIIGGELSDAVRAVASELGIEVIDLYTLTDAREEWFADGLHPNAAGNYAIAEAIASKINN